MVWKADTKVFLISFQILQQNKSRRNPLFTEAGITVMPITFSPRIDKRERIQITSWEGLVIWKGPAPSYGFTLFLVSIFVSPLPPLKFLWTKVHMSPRFLVSRWRLSLSHTVLLRRGGGLTPDGHIPTQLVFSVRTRHIPDWHHFRIEIKQEDHSNFVRKLMNMEISGWPHD